MKLRNILGVSALTFLLGMSVSGVSANADEKAATEPTNNTEQKINAQAGADTFDNVSANSNEKWDIANNFSSINLGKFSLGYTNNTHSQNKYTITPSLTSDGDINSTNSSIPNTSKTTFTTNLSHESSIDSSQININVGNQLNLGLKSNASKNMVANIQWSVQSNDSTPSNPNNK